MSKRQRKFEHAPRSYYPTPLKAVLPLLPHLSPLRFTYIEPCVGDGRLVDHLAELAPQAECVGQWDLEPKKEGVQLLDALEVPYDEYLNADMIITNPPWERDTLHAMIEKFHCSWLLFDTDWFFTKQAKPYKEYLVKMVTVGRVKWIEDSPSQGFDNCAWYLFNLHHGNNGYTKAY